MSSRSRWSSDSSTKTSSRTLRAIKRSRTAVSRWIVCSGEEDVSGMALYVGAVEEVTGNGSEVYGGLIKDWYEGR